MSLISRSWSDCRTVWNRYFHPIPQNSIPIKAEAYIWTGHDDQKFKKGIGRIGLDRFQEYSRHLKDFAGLAVHPTDADFHLTMITTPQKGETPIALSLIARILDYVLSYFKKMNPHSAPSLPPYLPSTLFRNTRENGIVVFEWKGRRYEYTIRQQLSPLASQKKNVEVLFQELNQYMQVEPSFILSPEEFLASGGTTVLEAREMIARGRRQQQRYRCNNYLSDLDKAVIDLSQETFYPKRAYSERAVVQSLTPVVSQAPLTPDNQSALIESLEKAEAAKFDVISRDGQYILIIDAPGIVDAQMILDNDNLTLLVRKTIPKPLAPVNPKATTKPPVIEQLLRLRFNTVIPDTGPREFIFVDVALQGRQISSVKPFLTEMGIVQLNISFKDSAQRQQPIAS